MPKLFFTIALFIAICFTGCQTKALTPQQKQAAQAKDLKTEQANIQKIDNQNFSFYPNTVEPEFGMVHMINSDAFVQLNNGNLNVQLPFLGSFFLDPQVFDLRPLEFMSSDYTYQVSKGNGTQYHVRITPNDLISVMRDGLVLDLYLNVETGDGTLIVKTYNTDEVSYYGYFQ